MIIRKTLFASTACVAIAAAFENDAGWKMDGDKLALDGDGNPIWINTAGQESSIKGDTITNLNREAKQHREGKEAAEAALNKYKGKDGKLVDPDVAIKAIDDMSKIDSKKLIDAGEVDRVRDEIKAEFTSQLTEKDQALAERDAKINNMLIDGVFTGSEFIAEHVAMPRDFFQAAMRQNFKVEDGKVIAHDKSGNRLMSKKNPGEYADPNEALQLLVDAHPQKDTILKAPEAGGTGGGGGGGNRGGGRVMKRSEYDTLPPHKQAELAGQMGKGEIKIVD